VALNLGVLGILLFKTAACLLHPEWLFGAPPAAAATDGALAYAKGVTELAGRNLAMVLVSVLALWRGSPAWYRAVFVMGLVRESMDAGLVVWFSGLGGLGQAASLLLFLTAYTLALRALREGCK
jgi:hypothetical protein